MQHILWWGFVVDFSNPSSVFCWHPVLANTSSYFTVVHLSIRVVCFPFRQLAVGEYEDGAEITVYYPFLLSCVGLASQCFACIMCFWLQIWLIKKIYVPCSTAFLLSPLWGPLEEKFLSFEFEIENFHARWTLEPLVKLSLLSAWQLSQENSRVQCVRKAVWWAGVPAFLCSGARFSDHHCVPHTGPRKVLPLSFGRPPSSLPQRNETQAYLRCIPYTSPY